MSTPTVQDILDLAIRNLETYGWIRGGYGSYEKGFCSIGTINAAVAELVTSRIPEHLTASFMTNILNEKARGLANETLAKLSQYLNEHPDLDAFTHVSTWNDCRVEGVEEVILTFKCLRENLDAT